MTIGEIKRGKELGYKNSGHNWVWSACEDCGKPRWVRFRHGKPESPRCRSCASTLNALGRVGEKSPFWKGGKKHSGGYVLIRIYPDDFFYPMAKRGGYVLEHRLVVAKALGRNLQRWEIVHHKKGFAKDDNRYPETLQLVTDERHTQITILENHISRLEKQIKAQGKRITLLEAENILLRSEDKIYNGSPK